MEEFMDFKELHRLFSKKETDLGKLQKEENFSRYILIRTLGKEHICEILDNNNLKPLSNDYNELYEQLFNTEVKNQEIISYIKNKYPEIRKQRQQEEAHLPDIIKNFGAVSCGIRNDNLNEESKKLVRDKSIASIEELNDAINDLLQNKVKGYLLWEYYNQATNDLIEHLFNDNKNVIPTLRKITYVDFLMEINGEIIPFDLKITHISDEYFNCLSSGLIPSDGKDSYKIDSNINEMKQIKDYYGSIKRTYGLPNYGGLKKSEIIEVLKEKHISNVDEKLNEFYAKRLEMVNSLEQNKKSIEWWNYKFQGERLFKNNNRFYIFLVYDDSFDDARPLKGKIELIADKVNTELNKLKNGKFNIIKYYYDKDPSVRGEYEIVSTSVLISSHCEGC